MNALTYCRCRDCLADRAQEEVERLFRDREALAERIERLIETCAIEGGVTDFARELAAALSEVEWTTGQRRTSAALGYFDRLRERVMEAQEASDRG